MAAFYREALLLSGMEAVKVVRQYYAPSSELLVLLDEFRRMVNDCIGIVRGKIGRIEGF